MRLAKVALLALAGAGLLAPSAGAQLSAGLSLKGILQCDGGICEDALTSGRILQGDCPDGFELQCRLSHMHTVQGCALPVVPCPAGLGRPCPMATVPCVLGELDRTIGDPRDTYYEPLNDGATARFLLTRPNPLPLPVGSLLGVEAYQLCIFTPAGTPAGGAREGQVLQVQVPRGMGGAWFIRVSANGCQAAAGADGGPAWREPDGPQADGLHWPCSPSCAVANPKGYAITAF